MTKPIQVQSVAAGKAEQSGTIEHKPQAVDAVVGALQFMLKLESEARSVNSVAELAFLTANSARKLSNARQVFVLQKTSAGRLETLAISSVAAVDRNSPLVRWIERIVANVARDDAAKTSFHFSLPAYCSASDAETATYPFLEMMWLPLHGRDGKLLGAVLLAREQPWTKDAAAPIERFAEVCAYSWQFLSQRAGWTAKPQPKSRLATIGCVLAAVLAFVPVPLIALAPAEVVARAPAVVAAPIDGVIGDILVEPSSRVKAGDVLFQFNDTQARNAAEVAEREVQVAEAKVRQAKQGAFVESSYNREVAVAEADLAVKKSERDYAREILAKSTVKADRDGLVLYADKRDLLGRPVSVGQRVMEIADPADVGLRILLPVDDISAVEPSGRVRMFLDSDPLNPIAGHIVRTSHVARLNEGNQLSFRVDAAPELNGAPPRLGLRGTAQVIGASVPLLYFVFRRPLSYLRQRFGV